MYLTILLPQLKITARKGGFMEIQLTKQGAVQTSEAIPQDKVDTCQRCANAYILIWLKEGEDYNDFGFRHCPFCGLLVDEFTGSVVE